MARIVYQMKKQAVLFMLPVDNQLVLSSYQTSLTPNVASGNLCIHINLSDS